MVVVRNVESFVVSIFSMIVAARAFEDVAGASRRERDARTRDVEDVIFAATSACIKAIRR